MLFVDNQNITDPRINLAVEEYLLRKVQIDEPLLLFYINEPSVIIGRNQNTLEEIDPDFVKAHNIHVVRRLSGGGAVYHDLGNLNFSFVTNGREDLHNFAKFTAPVVRVLQELGVDAELRGKSDIFAAGKKISGNAQYSTQNRMFSHGTILFDTDLEQMLKALNPGQIQIESRAVQSVRNFVTNIRELLTEDLTIAQFKQVLLSGIFGTDQIPTYELKDEDWEQIDVGAVKQYHLWDWNYGRSPNFNIQKSQQFPIGHIDARIDVAEGYIQGVKFYGNFIGQRDVAELEHELIGVRYERNALIAALREIKIAAYFGEIAETEFLNFLY